MSIKIPPIGSLRERVQLLRKEMSVDSAGGHVTNFVLIADVWANVKAANGRVSFEGDAAGSLVTHAVILRFRNDVKAGDRIVYRDEKLEIISSEDLNGRRAYLKCNCAKKMVVG